VSRELGGAELTQAEFRAAAPPGVEVVDCPPGGVVPGLDRYVIHNCVTYGEGDLERIDGEPVFKYWHDVGPHLQPEVRAWLMRQQAVCCSPVQAQYMDLTAAAWIPPAVNLDLFSAAATTNGARNGACCVASWRNFGKAPHRALEWGEQNGGIDFYGGGQLAPRGAREIPYEGMPQLLASYKHFVFLPTVLEPFGRLVAEAWAAGCIVTTNGLVGARYWIDEEPGRIGTAATDFWDLVLR
jgi:glycosyltransferase involved in cell wall biosynthesis